MPGRVWTRGAHVAGCGVPCVLVCRCGRAGWWWWCCGAVPVGAGRLSGRSSCAAARISAWRLLKSGSSGEDKALRANICLCASLCRFLKKNQNAALTFTAHQPAQTPKYKPLFCTEFFGIRLDGRTALVETTGLSLVFVYVCVCLPKLRTTVSG